MVEKRTQSYSDYIVLLKSQIFEQKTIYYLPILEGRSFKKHIYFLILAAYLACFHGTQIADAWEKETKSNICSRVESKFESKRSVLYM
jgi:hypothetical protein